MTIFWSETESQDLENRAAHTQHKFPRKRTPLLTATFTITPFQLPYKLCIFTARKRTIPLGGRGHFLGVRVTFVTEL